MFISISGHHQLVLYITKSLLSYSTFCVELLMDTNVFTSWSQTTCHVWCLLFLSKHFDWL